MKLFIYTDSKTAAKIFPVEKKNSPLSVEINKTADIKKTLKNIPGGSIVYMEALTDTKKTMQSITPIISRGDICTGVFDPKGIITDPALLFHNGACDYLGKELCKKSIDEKRLKLIADYSQITINESSTSSLYSGNDWKAIKQGKEYTFCMMFVELDADKNVRSAHFGSGEKKPAEFFRKFIDQQIEPTNGKIWMWHNLGGVILFPFDGESCDAIVPSLRMVLNKNIFGVEESLLNSSISFRIALHIGNTVYKNRGETGTIVSDTVNFIFHLGQKRAEKGSMYITKDILQLVPDKLKEYFVNEGTFEEREIHRLKKLM